MKNKFSDRLKVLYGDKEGEKLALSLVDLISKFDYDNASKNTKYWDEKDIALITYPDSIIEDNQKTLKTLSEFLNNFIKDKINIVHILPFFEYSGDRGFSITDYRKVKSEFGDWEDVSLISSKYRLMADFVANHVSKSHEWFKEFLNGNKKYEDYFIWFDKDNLPDEDEIKKVRRGRATPLLTPFETKSGLKYLWTTYSIGSLIDQIDLNYKNPEVFLEAIKTLLFYLKKDFSIIRLDGIGGLWKKLGTSCKHLPENHIIVSLFRDIIEELKTNTLLFTETTTATHDENISYMKQNEANAVYNFMLAPLVLNSFYKSDTNLLTNLAKKFDPGSQNTFFNILDIHDGINLYSISHEVDESKLETLITEVKNRGGVFSYRSLSNGEKAVKEMHITWWSAINKEGELPFDLELKRFITSRAMAMALKGIPAVYYLSLIGARNDTGAYEKSGIGRDMNRTNLAYLELKNKLTDENSREYKIFNALMSLMEERKNISAFHPDEKQEILNLDRRIFALLRGEGENAVLALHNVSGDIVNIKYANMDYTILPYSYLWERIKK